MAGLGELLASIGANVGRAGMPQQQNGGGGFLSRLLGEPYRGLRDVAGTAGDALLIANDAAPMYAPQKREHQIGEAFAQFVGPELADLARVSPELAYRIRAEQNSGGEGFTLGENQVRYNAGGDEIARGPQGAPKITVIDGVAYDERTGQPLFESPYPRVIPGQNGAFYEQPRLGLGQNSPPSPQASGNAPAILQQATARGYILPDEIGSLRQQLGPNGQGVMQGWMQQNRVRIATRTGTTPDGRKVVQFEDGTVEYAD